MTEFDPHEERYLWDPQAAGEAGVERLEALLRPLGHDSRYGLREVLQDAKRANPVEAAQDPEDEWRALMGDTAGPQPELGDEAARQRGGALLLLPWLAMAGAAAALLFVVFATLQYAEEHSVDEVGDFVAVASGQILTLEAGEQRGLRFGTSSRLELRGPGTLEVESARPPVLRIESGRVEVNLAAEDTLELRGPGWSLQPTEGAGPGARFDARVGDQPLLELTVEAGLLTVAPDEASLRFVLPGMTDANVLEPGWRQQLVADPDLEQRVAEIESGDLGRKATKGKGMDWELRELVREMAGPVSGPGSLRLLSLLADPSLQPWQLEGVYDALVDAFEEPPGGSVEALRENRRQALEAWAAHLAPHWR